MDIKIPESETLQLYWRKLGSFVHAFADAETQLIITLYDIAGLDQNIGAVLLSGMKVDLASNKIRKLYQVREETIPSDLEEALNHLSQIAFARNLILHHGIDYSELLFGQGAIQARNWRSPTNGKNEQRSDPETLAKMTSDLNKITLVLTHYAKKIVELTDEAEASFARLRARPWQYEPEQPSGKRQKRQRNPQARQRTHQSSER